MRRLLAAAVAALALPGAALAHTSVRESTPDYQERLATSPRAVVLEFTQGVKPLPRSIEVRDARGTLVSRGLRTRASERHLAVSLRPLGRGAYTVRWHALSLDGHVLSGVFTFGVQVEAPPPTEAFGAAGPTTAEHVVRWIYFVALGLLLGGLGFRLIVIPGKVPAPFERRFYLVTGVGVVAVIEAGIVAFLLRAEGALQLPFGRLLYGDLTPLAEGTRLGVAFIAMTLGYVLVASLLFLAWLTDRAALLWPAFLVALGFASGLSLSGHASTDERWLSPLADWVHLTAGALWIGGLVQLAFCVWPAAPELRRRAFLGFSRLAGALIAVVVAAGVYMSVARLPELADLWTESYGRILILKVGLVSLALAWGAFHHFRVRPVLERGTGEARLGFLPRSLVGESAVAMAILLVAAVLVNSSPPEAAKTPAATPAASAR